MGIGSKLDALIKCRHRNVNDVAKSANVPASTVYSIIKRDNTKADLDDLQSLANELGVTLSYFIDSPQSRTALDMEVSLNLSGVEYELIQKYRTLDESGKNTVDTVLKIQFDRCNAPDNQYGVDELNRDSELIDAVTLCACDKKVD